MELPPFENLVYYNFKDPEPFRMQKEAIKNLSSFYGKTYDLYIDGKWEKGENEPFPTNNPSFKAETLAHFSNASVKQTIRAILSAEKAYQSWQYTPYLDRVSIILKACDIYRQRRLEGNACLIKEIGKNFLEADAETCEAIDFLEYYAREMIRYSQPKKLVQTPGEINSLNYIPLGTIGIITPFNFPLAFLLGIVGGAIITGNTVVLKPSTRSSLCAYWALQILLEAGLPPGVLNFVPATDHEIARTIISHPQVRMLAFTGSVDVGVYINEKAAILQKGQKWLKRVMLEMGGKGCIIVDEEADIDSAVQGVIAGSFSYQGQKCSACSRVIVDKMVYDEFIGKLKEETEKLQMGPSEDNFYMGPVASEFSLQKVMKYIDIGKMQNKLLTGGNLGDPSGYYVQPTIFIDVKPRDRLAQEEIFGPVLSIIKSENFEDAINIHNDTIFGLTGAVYTKNKEKLEIARKRQHCGNLYFNRKNTGAFVGAQPFGGFDLSGTGPKAGGPDYLGAFLQAKAICEKIMK